MTPFSRWERELPKLLNDHRFQAVPTTKDRRAFFDDYCKNAASRPIPAAAAAKPASKASGVAARAAAKPSGAAGNKQAAAEEETEEGEEVIDREGPLPQGSDADAFNELLDEAEAAERDDGALRRPLNS